MFEDLRDKLKESNIDLINVSEGAIKIYKNQVKENFYESNIQTILKLNRNWILGTIIGNGDYEEKRVYGNLEITYSKTQNEIVSVWNSKYPKRIGKIDKVERARLDKILGIKEDKVA